MDEDTLATTADFLFRYMLVRHLHIGGPPPSSLLADEIRWGVRAIDHIDIDPEANPPLTTDGAADDFFRAIVRGDNNAMPDMKPADLAAHRDYVLRGGALPLRVPEEDNTAPGLVVRWPGVRRRGC
jgi:hypothetical protein